MHHRYVNMVCLLPPIDKWKNCSINKSDWCSKIDEVILFSTSSVSLHVGFLTIYMYWYCDTGPVIHDFQHFFLLPDLWVWTCLFHCGSGLPYQFLNKQHSRWQIQSKIDFWIWWQWVNSRMSWESWTGMQLLWCEMAWNHHPLWLTGKTFAVYQQLTKEEKWMQHQLRTCYTPLLLWTVSLHMTSSKSETAPRWNCRHLLGQFEKVGGTVQKNAQPCVCQCNPHLHLMTYLVRLQDRFTAAWVTGLGTYEEESEKKLVAAAAHPK